MVKPSERKIREYVRNGLILLDKPSGPSSHQVDGWVKQVFADVMTINKNSHGGTLDPRTSGVLAIAMENSTKLMPILLKSRKEYVALMMLHSDVPQEKIRTACDEFVGKIKQLPPLKSAVLRAVREREIYSLEILEIRGREVLMRVGCEAGTYIRRLHDDIGKRLGTGAHMQELRRTKSGIFMERELVTLQDLSDAIDAFKKGDESLLRKVVIPLESIRKNIKSVEVKDSAVDAICNGAPLGVQGCTKIEKGILKGDLVGYFTKIGEMIGFGNAVKDYKKDFKRGMFIKTDRVLMKKGTYDKKWGKSGKQNK
jgi:H/ACA ribonucleoprotein complex subunit 4